MFNYEDFYKLYNCKSEAKYFELKEQLEERGISTKFISFAVVNDSIVQVPVRSNVELSCGTGSFANADFVVTLSAEFGESINWRISVQNNTSYVIEWIDLPQIAVKNELPYKGGNKKLLWGFNEGAIVEDLSLKEAMDAFKYRDPEYPQEGTMCIYPGIVETQFMAYYGERGGIYIGTHDNRGNVKGIDFEPIDDCIRLRFRLFTGLDFGDSFDMDYDFVMQSFEGDWHDAADKIFLTCPL